MNTDTHPVHMLGGAILWLDGKTFRAPWYTPWYSRRLKRPGFLNGIWKPTGYTQDVAEPHRSPYYPFADPDPAEEYQRNVEATERLLKEFGLEL
jgi:hypothetical protein